MIRATWNGTVIAESDRTTRIEGNHYFPLEDIETEFLTDSQTQTRCFWKGKASYYDVVIDGQTNPDAAWTYPKPTFLARGIKDHVAFWQGVKVERVRTGR